MTVRNSRSPMCTGEVLVPPSGEPCPAKCLGSATTVWSVPRRIALSALDVGQPNLAGEVGVFAEVLFDAAPARLAGQVQHRREDHVDARGAGFGSDGCAGLAGDLGIPGGGQIDRRGKDRAVSKSVQALFDEQCGNAEAVVSMTHFWMALACSGVG